MTTRFGVARLLSLICCLSSVVFFPAFAGETFSTPDAAAAAFYKIYLKLHVMDVPDARHRAKFKPVLTDELFSLLALADQAEARYAKKNERDPVPPLYEGDLFSSEAEGASSVGPISCDAKPDMAVCAATLHLVDKSQGKTADFVWTDRLHIILTHAGWRVDDLEYGGTWQFGPHGRLKDILKDIDKQSREN